MNTAAPAPAPAAAEMPALVETAAAAAPAAPIKASQSFAWSPKSESAAQRGACGVLRKYGAASWLGCGRAGPLRCSSALFCVPSAWLPTVSASRALCYSTRCGLGRSAQNEDDQAVSSILASLKDMLPKKQQPLGFLQLAMDNGKRATVRRERRSW